MSRITSLLLSLFCVVLGSQHVVQANPVGPGGEFYCRGPLRTGVTQNHMHIGFTPGTVAADNGASLSPGTCSWNKRGLTKSEASHTTIEVSLKRRGSWQTEGLKKKHSSGSHADPKFSALLHCISKSECVFAFTPYKFQHNKIIMGLNYVRLSFPFSSCDGRSSQSTGVQHQGAKSVPYRKNTAPRNSIKRQKRSVP